LLNVPFTFFAFKANYFILMSQLNYMLCSTVFQWIKEFALLGCYSYLSRDLFWGNTSSEGERRC